MLLSKSIKIKWHNTNKKWFMDKGYIYTKTGDEFLVNVKDLKDECTSTVQVKCDSCGDVMNIMWRNYRKTFLKNNNNFCRKCCFRKEFVSFEQWCKSNLPEEKANKILLRWDYDKNNNSPSEVCCSSGKGYWFKCVDNPEHASQIKNINNLSRGRQNSIDCNECSSISVTHPSYVKYFVNKEDTIKYSYASSKKVTIMCPNCKSIKKITISSIFKTGIGCSKCSDGISYPNKFGFNLLQQLHIDFIPEYCPSWISPKRYDFFFEVNNQKYILELDGGMGHGNYNNLSQITKEESLELDKYKEFKANENNIKLIRIDCKISDLDYIKNNILNSELSTLFDLSNINWLQCHEYSCSSLVKKACDLWNSEIKSTSRIGEILKVNFSTVIRYLKQGVKVNWCDYNPLTESKKTWYTDGQLNKKVICTTTSQVFDSIKEAAIFGGLKSSSSIVNQLKQRRNFAGTHPITGEKLKWEYYDNINNTD